MKKLVYISCLFLFYGCIFTYDPARGLLYVHNNSNEAVYVYLKCGKTDVLPSEPKLELFEFFNNEDGGMLDALGNPLKSGFVSPEYRINAYHRGSLHIGGNRKKPRLPCEENEVTLFFITEKTMRNYDWEEIHKNQMFVKKTTLTKEELENKNWIVTYP
jgi:hypothetical protein